MKIKVKYAKGIDLIDFLHENGMDVSVVQLENEKFEFEWTNISKIHWEGEIQENAYRSFKMHVFHDNIYDLVELLTSFVNQGLTDCWKVAFVKNDGTIVYLPKCNWVVEC